MTGKPKVIKTYEGILQTWDPPLSYRVDKKAIRHVYFRIKQGQLMVSVPRHVSLPRALQLIDAHREAILRLIRRTRSVPSVTNAPQSEWTVVGHSYTLQHGARFAITSTHIVYPFSWLPHRLQREVALRILPPLMDQWIAFYWPSIDATRPAPTYRFKTMKRLYGVYYHHDHIITFNTYLIHLAEEVIRYVVLHELMHAVHLNHSSSFYDAIAQLMPDYRRIHDQLKQSGIAHFDSKR